MAPKKAAKSSGPAKGASKASSSATAPKKRKAAEAELGDDPLDEEGQNAVLTLLTSLAKDCLAKSGLTGEKRSAAKAQLNDLLALAGDRVREIRVPGGKVTLPDDDAAGSDGNVQHSIDAAHAELVKLDEELEDEAAELEQSKADLRTFERRRAAVEEREADEERDKLDPLVRSLFPASSSKRGRADAESEDATWVTVGLPAPLPDDIANPETEAPDPWLADFAARAMPAIERLQKAYAPLEPLERILPERKR